MFNMTRMNEFEKDIYCQNIYCPNCGAKLANKKVL